MKNTERQKALYEYLLNKGDNFTFQYQVCYDLCEYYGYMQPKDIDFHNTKTRLLLTNDIREINKSYDYEKIIISNNNGIKLANEEEFSKMLKGLYISTLSKLKRINIIKKKGGLDGQTTIEGEEIKAFIKEM